LEIPYKILLRLAFSCGRDDCGLSPFLCIWDFDLFGRHFVYRGFRARRVNMKLSYRAPLSSVIIAGGLLIGIRGLFLTGLFVCMAGIFILGYEEE
jgi:hypothetical protein